MTDEMSIEDYEKLINGLVMDLARIRDMVREHAGSDYGDSYYGEAEQNPSKVATYVKHVFKDMKLDESKIIIP